MREFTIQQFIMIGMLREVKPLAAPSAKSYDTLPQLNLGAGVKDIDGVVHLDLPKWDADVMPIPYADESVCGIWALHFLEHLWNPVELLKEAQRVLTPGGVMNIVVPFYTSSLHHSDLDHKHTFTEQTFKKLFRQKLWYNKGQEAHEWQFDIHFNLIIGVEEKNLALFTQLVKT